MRLPTAPHERRYQPNQTPPIIIQTLPLHRIDSESLKSPIALADLHPTTALQILKQAGGGGEPSKRLLPLLPCHRWAVPAILLVAAFFFFDESAVEQAWKWRRSGEVQCAGWQREESGGRRLHSLRREADHRCLRWPPLPRLLHL